MKDYIIIEKTKTETEVTGYGISKKEVVKKVELTEADRMYVNPYMHSLSIRLPPINEQIDFRIKYEVMPQNNERQFFKTVVFALIEASVFFTLISLHLIKAEWLFLLKPIQQHLNTFFGGLVTISVAAIGFSNKPILSRTRFWFIIPIVISAIGFLLRK